MKSFDYTGKHVLVVGGASGIGNATARMFHEFGAKVQVTGTRASPEAYGPDEAYRFDGLSYSQLIIIEPTSVTAWRPDISNLDILVLSQ